MTSGAVSSDGVTEEEGRVVGPWIPMRVVDCQRHGVR